MEKEPQNTTIRLHGGEQIALSVRETALVYDELWLLAKRMRGAIAAAAKLKRVDAWTLLHGEDALTEDETLALREALRRAHLAT